MKRSPLRRRKGLRKVSAKQKKGLAEYYPLRNKYLEDYPWCEACHLSPSTEVHHLRGRGKYLCDVNYFMAVDRKCHRWIHDNPAEARKIGWLISKFQKD